LGSESGATRLAPLNAFRDAAEASRSCGKDEAKITAAIRANDAVLDLWPNSAFADDCLYQNAQLWPRLERSDKALEANLRLAEDYPASDLADDALWQAAQALNAEHEADLLARVLLRLVRHYPLSPYRWRALERLARLELGDPLEMYALATDGPTPQPWQPGVLFRLAQAFEKEGHYERAAALYTEVAGRFPDNDLADDALCCAAKVLLAARAPREAALHLLAQLLAQYPCSNHADEAARLMHRLDPTCRLEEPGASVEAARLFQRAQFWVARRQLSLAIDCYGTILEHFPGSDYRDDALWGMAECFAALAKTQEQLGEAVLPEQAARAAGELYSAGAGQVPADMLALTFDCIGRLVAEYPSSPFLGRALTLAAECHQRADDSVGVARAFAQLLPYAPSLEELEKPATLLFECLEGTRGEDSQLEAYGFLCEALPALFPPDFASSPAQVRRYGRHCAQAAADVNYRKVPLSAANLSDDALFYSAVFHLEEGNAAAAAQRLEALLGQYPGGDFTAPALWLSGLLAAGAGDQRRARDAWQALRSFKASGLVDDAEAALTATASIERFDLDVMQLDNVAIAAGLLDGLRLREYDLPKMLDEACEALAQWSGVQPREAPLLLGAEVEAGGVEPFARISGDVLGDPPNWSAIFGALVDKWLLIEPLDLALGSVPNLRQALARVAAAQLQYDLVHETRDVIGSPAASRVPNQEVLEARARVLDCFAHEAASGRQAQDMSAEALCGYLFSRLEALSPKGQGTINWWPLRDFFRTVVSRGQQVGAEEPAARAAVVMGWLEDSLAGAL